MIERRSSIAAAIGLLLALVVGRDVAAAPSQPSTRAMGDNCASPYVIPTLPYETLDSTNAFVDDFPPGPCTPGHPQIGIGRDVVYSYTAPGPNPDSVWFFVEPRGGWDVSLIITQAPCGSASGCVAASNSGGPGGAEQVLVTLQPFTTYYAVVDGVANSQGTYAFLCYRASGSLCSGIATGALVPTIATATVTPPPMNHSNRAIANPSNKLDQPTACHAYWHGPDPLFGPDNVRLFTTNAFAIGSRSATLDLPRTAMARVVLDGNYRLINKSHPGPIPCMIDFGTGGTIVAWTRSLEDFLVGRAPNFAVASRVASSMVAPLLPPAQSQDQVRCSSGPGQPECNNTKPFSWYRQAKGLCNPGVAYPIHLEFLSTATGLDGYANSIHTGFTVNVQCADPPLANDGPTDHSGVTVSVSPLTMRAGRVVQSPAITLPGGFYSTFLPTDSTDVPSVVAASDGQGFGQRLYVTQVLPLRADDQSPSPDTCRMQRFEGFAHAAFGSASLRAPSGGRFDTAGAFGYRLLLATVDSVTASGQIPAGHGALVAMDANGDVATIADHLPSTAAVAVGEGGVWTDRAYVVDPLEGRILRIDPFGVVETFASGMGITTDVCFGLGGAGAPLYVTEGDTLEPVGWPANDTGRLSVLATDGSRTTLAAGLHEPRGMAQAPGIDAFGTDLYVALYDRFDSDTIPVPGSGRVVRVSQDGTVMPFADGLEQPMRLAFSEGRLYVGVAGGVLRINPGTPEWVGPADRSKLALTVSAWPSPAQDVVSVRYVAARALTGRVEVFDMLGRRVDTLVSGSIAAGEHRVEWRTRDAAGRSVAPGIYAIVMRSSAGDQATTRVLVMR